MNLTRLLYICSAKTDDRNTAVFLQADKMFLTDDRNIAVFPQADKMFLTDDRNTAVFPDQQGRSGGFSFATRGNRCNNTRRNDNRPSRISGDQSTGYNQSVTSCGSQRRQCSCYSTKTHVNSMILILKLNLTSLRNIYIKSGLRWAPHTFLCICFSTKSNSNWGLEFDCTQCHQQIDQKVSYHTLSHLVHCKRFTNNHYN